MWGRLACHWGSLLLICKCGNDFPPAAEISHLGDTIWPVLSFKIFYTQGWDVFFNYEELLFLCNASMIEYKISWIPNVIYSVIFSDVVLGLKYWKKKTKTLEKRPCLFIFLRKIKSLLFYEENITVLNGVMLLTYRPAEEGFPLYSQVPPKISSHWRLFLAPVWGLLHVLSGGSGLAFPFFPPFCYSVRCLCESPLWKVLWK